CLSLYRLDDESRRLLAGQRFFERDEIVEVDLLRIGHQVAETLAKEVGSVERERTRGQAMERVVAVDDLLAAGGAARELDGGFDALGARVGEEDAGQVGAGGAGV